VLREYFQQAYTARNLIVSAVRNVEHERVRELVEKGFGSLPANGSVLGEHAPQVVPKVLIRNKELEQSHLCVGVSSYPQNHDDRYASYLLRHAPRGSMSSRLFQNVREKRGLRLRGLQRTRRVPRRRILHRLCGCSTTPSAR